MSKQLGFLLNQKYCIGCQACQTACQARNNSDAGISLRVADSFEDKPEEVYLTASCHHCENPACVEVCPVGAISKREEDGIVVSDYDTCIGCQACIMACPYDAPKFNEKTNKTEKCDFCLDRVLDGLEPECVLTCPVKVLKHGEIEELDKLGVKEGVNFLVEDTKPCVRFILP